MPETSAKSSTNWPRPVTRHWSGATRPLSWACSKRSSITKPLPGAPAPSLATKGLGCIYWHMVSKLLLAAQESFFRAADTGASPAILEQLAACYYDIRAGIGDAKSPEVYGAFPMDPYSHTPGHTGARQPGLTGQVKEDILCRWGELGVFVRGGQLCFRPRLLRREEFLAAPGEFNYWDVSGKPRRLRLKAGSLAFTYCQTPIIYQLGREDSLTLWYADGSRRAQDSLQLDLQTSRSVFERSGRIDRIVVSLGPSGHDA